jgi:3-phenylpropionate/cinnamic acid dioxygenase small subunit
MMAEMPTLTELGREIPLREAAYLDDRRWDEWLALFAPDCEYWVPTWLTEDELSTDPQTEISHIYYASRAGLEDRIVRIRSDRSPATMPMRRTTHIVGSVLVTGGNDKDMQLRSSWACHVFEQKHKKVHTLFGHAEYRLRRVGADWCIAAKKTVLQNDYLPSVVDIYCL